MKLSIVHFPCFFLSSLQNSLYLGLPELRSTTEDWIPLILISTTFRTKCTKSHYVVSCLWISECFFLYVWNVLFQAMLVTDTGILWNVPWSLFSDPGKSWLLFITTHKHAHMLSIYSSFYPTRTYSPKQSWFFYYLLCPLPNRGHNTYVIYILVVTKRSSSSSCLHCGKRGVVCIKKLKGSKFPFVLVICLYSLYLLKLKININHIKDHYILSETMEFNSQMWAMRDGIKENWAK